MFSRPRPTIAHSLRSSLESALGHCGLAGSGFRPKHALAGRRAQVYLTCPCHPTYARFLRPAQPSNALAMLARAQQLQLGGGQAVSMTAVE